MANQRFNVQTSIVDYLKSRGLPSDFSFRKSLAEQYGIRNYVGSAEQNIRLLNLLRSGASPSRSTSSSTTPTTPTSYSRTESTPSPTPPSSSPPSLFPSQILSTISGIVSSFMQPAQQLAGALGIQPPQQIPAEATPASILQDIQTYTERARETLERGKEEAARLARERIEALRPEVQQVIATMHNVGGFSQEMLDRIVKNWEIIAKADSEIRLAYDQAIATGDLETARALVQTKASLYQSFVQERNLYVNTMANLLNTVAQMRLYPYQEQQLQAATMIQNLQAASSLIEFSRQIFAPRLGQIRSEADLRPDERTFLQSFSRNLSTLLGADSNVIYRQILRILSQKPKVGQISTIVGDQGTMFIVIDENGQLRTWVDPTFTKTTRSSLIPKLGQIPNPTP